MSWLVAEGWKLGRRPIAGAGELRRPLLHDLRCCRLRLLLFGVVWSWRRFRDVGSDGVPAAPTPVLAYARATLPSVGGPGPWGARDISIHSRGPRPTLDSPLQRESSITRHAQLAVRRLKPPRRPIRRLQSLFHQGGVANTVKGVKRGGLLLGRTTTGAHMHIGTAPGLDTR
jgi:hypothetical protein